jgi:hypothetical protein
MAVRHVTLTANTEKVVSLARDLREVGILHKGNGVEPVYVRLDGTAAAINADDAYVVLPSTQRWVPRIWSSGKPTNVSIISAGAIDVEVEFP